MYTFKCWAGISFSLLWFCQGTLYAFFLVVNLTWVDYTYVFSLANLKIYFLDRKRTLTTVTNEVWLMTWITIWKLMVILVKEPDNHMMLKNIVKRQIREILRQPSLIHHLINLSLQELESREGEVPGISYAMSGHQNYLYVPYACLSSPESN